MLIMFCLLPKHDYETLWVIFHLVAEFSQKQWFCILSNKTSFYQTNFYKHKDYWTVHLINMDDT